MNEHDESREFIYPREWFYSSLPSPFVSRAPNDSLQFLRVFYPFSLSYYSRFIPLFSPELTQLEELAPYEVVSFRDGLVPLLWFFGHGEKFLEEQTYFLIDYRLRHWVSSRWKDRVGLYSVTKNEELNSFKKKKKLLISGFIFRDYFTESHLKKFISELKKNLGVSLKKMDIEVFLPTYGGSGQQKTYYQIFKLIEKNLGPIKKFWEIEDITWLKYIPNCFGDYVLVNLNQGMFFCDDFITHFILKSGASFWEADVIPENHEGLFKLALSPEHHLRVLHRYDFNNDEEKIAKLLQDIHVLFDDKENDPLPPEQRWPWPLDYMKFVFEYCSKDEGPSKKIPRRGVR